MNTQHPLILMTPELVAAVSNTFTENLAAAMGYDNLAKVRMRNLFPEYEASCASHEFADANQCMWDAVCDICGLDEAESDPTNEAIHAIMVAAWGLARACSFRMPFQLKRTTSYDGKETTVVEHHTLTYFAEGDDYGPQDLFAIHALERGESYIINGQTARQFITRLE